jgi:hypothetical protein
MKPHESGYPDVVRDRPATIETAPAASQAFRNVAAVVLVLGVVGEGDVVAADFTPQIK